MWCARCERRCHQRCSGIRDVLRVGVDLCCPTCVGEGQREVDVRQVQMREVPVKVVDSFCYFGDVVWCEGGAEAAVRGRMACAWKSWRELASLFVNQNILLRSRAQVYRACVKLVLQYGAEAWVTTKQLDGRLVQCDVRKLRYLMTINWQDGILL